MTTFEQRLLDSLLRCSNEFRLSIEKMLNYGRQLAKKMIELDMVLPICSSDTSVKTVAAIYGSNRIITTIGGLHLALVLTSFVVMDQKLEVIKRDNPEVKLFLVNDPNEDFVKNVLEDLMLYAETITLQKVDQDTVMIDGPIIDPPRPVDEHSLEYFERIFDISFKDVFDYHRFRASVIKNVIAKGCVVVGVVKRIGSDRIFINLLRELDGKVLKIYANDDVAATIVMNYIYRISPEYTRCMLVTKPRALKLSEGFEEIYRDGVTIWYSFVIPNPMTKPYRIEIVTRNSIDDVFLNTLRLIKRTTLPGTRLPLPVVLAHEGCRIELDTLNVLSRIFIEKTIPREDLDLITKLLL